LNIKLAEALVLGGMRSSALAVLCAIYDRLAPNINGGAIIDHMPPRERRLAAV